MKKKQKQKITEQHKIPIFGIFHLIILKEKNIYKNDG